MKNYTITVNGNVYDVTVEEKAAGAIQTAPVAPVPSAPVPAAAPAQAAAPAPAAPAPAQTAASSEAGSIIVAAGAAGKVFKVEASVGQQMKKGDTVIILEAMKMEIPVVAPEDGTIVSVDVAVGDAVEAGAVMATLN